jgi:hypothetical protein
MKNLWVDRCIAHQLTICSRGGTRTLMSPVTLSTRYKLEEIHDYKVAKVIPTLTQLKTLTNLPINILSPKCLLVSHLFVVHFFANDTVNSFITLDLFHIVGSIRQVIEVYGLDRQVFCLQDFFFVARVGFEPTTVCLDFYCGGGKTRTCNVSYFCFKN